MTTTELEHVQIGSNLDSIEDHINSLAEAGSTDQLAELLAELTIISRLLASQVRHCEAQLAGIMDKRIEAAGYVFERRRAVDRKAWDWPVLLPRLIRLSLDPDNTGELPDTLDAIERLKALITDVVGVTPSKGPRVTALRGLGLDPDEWCESKPGRVSVQITGLPEDAR